MLRIISSLSRGMAIIGGVVLLALVLLVCLSVIGRQINACLNSDLVMALIPGFAQALLELGVGPINGDFELVEAGMAFSIFAFLPLCQVSASHAVVDLLSLALPLRAQRYLQAFAEIVFAIALIIIAIQLNAGLGSKMRSGQTTLLLQFPVWWSYAASLIGAVMAAVAGTFMAALRLTEAVVNRDFALSSERVDH